MSYSAIKKPAQTDEDKSRYADFTRNVENGDVIRITHSIYIYIYTPKIKDKEEVSTAKFQPIEAIAQTETRKYARKLNA